MAGGGDQLQRLFIGVPLPERLLGFVQGAQALLPQTAGLRLLAPEQLHVTLAFIGEVDGAKAAAAREIVGALAVDEGGWARIGRFLLLPSPGRARVVGLEIDDDREVITRLFEKVMGGLEAEGVMLREKRPFRPHLTVARLKRPGPVQPRSECGEVEFEVESVCLYESELRREGAVYTVVTRASLTQDHRAKAQL